MTLKQLHAYLGDVLLEQGDMPVAFINLWKDGDIEYSELEHVQINVESKKACFDSTAKTTDIDTDGNILYIG